MRTLYRGGVVHTAYDPFATAMLVDDGTVAWVGGDEAASAQGADRVVDLDGALVTAAFVDAHVHVTDTGLLLDGVDLTAARSVVQVLDAVAAAAARRPGGQVLGHGWDEAHLAEGRPPTRAELDRAAGGAAVYLSRVDVHSAVVSSALADACGAAELPGWDDSGRVERDAHHAALERTRSALTPGERAHAQRRALRAAAAAGVAAVHEMSAPHLAPDGDLAALLRLVADPDEHLPEVVGYVGRAVTSAQEAREVAAAAAGGDDDPGPRVAGLAGDLCVDGSFGSRTAALREPYLDAPGHDGHRGHLYLDAGEVAAHVVACTRAGLQAGFHVIGDAALDTVVAGLRAAAEVVGAPALRAARHRLEHVEGIDGDGIEVLADLAVAASVQPAFDALWGGDAGMYAARLGSRRALATNPFASLAAAGVVLALGSDAPVTPFDPWGAVSAATFHHERSQRISARAAFGAHTRGAWRAAGDDMHGVLRPGWPATFAIWEPADLVVQAPDDRIQAWSTDPRSGTPGLPDVSPDRPRPRCRTTVLRGRTLFTAS